MGEWVPDPNDPSRSIWQLDEVVVIGQRSFSDEFIYVWDYENTYYYKLKDEKKADKLFEKQIKKTIKDLAKAYFEPFASLHSLIEDNKFSGAYPWVEELLTKVLEKLKAQGIAITPAIRLLALSSVVSFLNENNPMSVDYKYYIKSNKGIDSIFYDVLNGNVILEVQNRNKPDSAGNFFTQHFEY